MAIERQVSIIPKIAPTEPKSLTVLSLDNNPIKLNPTLDDADNNPAITGCLSKLSNIV